MQSVLLWLFLHAFGIASFIVGLMMVFYSWYLKDYRNIKISLGVMGSGFVAYCISQILLKMHERKQEILDRDLQAYKEKYGDVFVLNLKYGKSSSMGVIIVFIGCGVTAFVYSQYLIGLVLMSIGFLMLSFEIRYRKLPECLKIGVDVKGIALIQEFNEDIFVCWTQLRVEESKKRTSLFKGQEQQPLLRIPWSVPQINELQEAIKYNTFKAKSSENTNL